MDLYIEDELKYCPRCREEYRAEIETCADCEITLLTGVAMKALLAEKQAGRKKGDMEIKPDDELVDIRRGQLLQMKELQNLLADNGLPALVVKDESGCGQGCCGTGMLLRVRMADIQEVMAVLEEEHVRTTGLHEYDTSHADAVFNTHAEQATCPACGCTFPTSQATCPDCGLCFA
jgi:phage terminase large subunit-like protein